MPLTREECYSLLQLSVDADEGEVRKAYKKLALLTHPDKNPDDPDANKKFLQISEAYKRIVDPESFRDEDEEGGVTAEQMNTMFTQMFAQMFTGRPFRRGSSGACKMDMFDIMEAMLNGDDCDDEEDDLYNDEDGIDGFSLDPIMTAMLMGGGGIVFEDSAPRHRVRINKQPGIRSHRHSQARVDGDGQQKKHKIKSLYKNKHHMPSGSAEDVEGDAFKSATKGHNNGSVDHGNNRKNNDKSHSVKFTSAHNDNSDTASKPFRSVGCYDKNEVVAANSEKEEAKTDATADNEADDAQWETDDSSEKRRCRGSSGKGKKKRGGSKGMPGMDLGDVDLEEAMMMSILMAALDGSSSNGRGGSGARIARRKK